MSEDQTIVDGIKDLDWGWETRVMSTYNII